MARLARLSLSDAEIAGLRRDLSAVLDHVDTIRSIDVDGAAPFARPGDRTVGPDELTADEPRSAMPVADLLALAPLAEGPFISVPKVLETGG